MYSFVSPSAILMRSNLWVGPDMYICKICVMFIVSVIYSLINTPTPGPTTWGIQLLYCKGEISLLTFTFMYINISVGRLN